VGFVPSRDDAVDDEQWRPLGDHPPNHPQQLDRPLVAVVVQAALDDVDVPAARDGLKEVTVDQIDPLAEAPAGEDVARFGQDMGSFEQNAAQVRVLVEDGGEQVSDPPPRSTTVENREKSYAATTGPVDAA
jgi:hypothetical protein